VTDKKVETDEGDEVEVYSPSSRDELHDRPQQKMDLEVDDA
jgi:hypothetical protein